MKIDFNKPVVTKKGKLVSILTTDGPDKEFPIVGNIEGSTTLRCWDADGVFKGKNRAFDLENTTPCAPFTTEVTDGHGRVMLRLFVVPEDNKVVIEKEDCILMYEGRDVLNGHIPPRNYSSAQPVDRTKKSHLPGDLASAFFNSINLRDDVLQE